MSRTYEYNPSRLHQLSILMFKYAFGYENRKTAKFFQQKLLEEYGQKATTRYIQAALPQTPRCGFSSGMYGGYFIISNADEARSVIAECQTRADALHNRITELQKLYNIE